MNKDIESKAAVRTVYEDPRDDIRQPDATMALSHYYVDRWLPELGERGHIIVTVLRRHGYYQRKQNIVREEVEIDQEALAALCGLKLRTFQREFAGDADGRPVNPALHKFVQRQFHTYQNAAGHVVREKTVYVVQMKDPIHDADLAELAAIVEAREKGADNEDSRSRQLGANGSPRSRQVGGTTRQVGGRSRQVGGPARQVGGPARQVGGNYKVDSDSYDFRKTLEDAAAPREEVLASLFPGEEPEPETDGPPPGAILPWTDLTDAARQAFRERAKAELHRYALEAGAERWARIGPRQEDVRARHIYETEQKGEAWAGKIQR